MLYPIRIVDIDLSQPITTIEGLDNYMGLQALVRLHGVPIGFIYVPVTNGYVSAKTLSKIIVKKHSQKIVKLLLQNGLSSVHCIRQLSLEDLFDVPPSEYTGELPLVTVAVCTRDRTPDLALCLEALCQLEYSNLDLLVIDNAPSNDETEHLVKTTFPLVRYVCEPRPGLDWARNRAVMEAKGEIIAFTDDDVIVDSKWVQALATLFAEQPEVMALTGLVIPYELETESQALFEMYGGFGRGFERRSWQMPHKKLPWQRMGAGQYGTGANMAFRTCLFDKIGLFDPALDVGTVTNGGGDMEMFFRVLKEGYTLVYEPSAIVRHRHRRELSKLYSQIANNGIGLYAFWVRCALKYPNERWTLLRAGIWWFWWWNLRRYIRSYLLPSRFPRSIILAELRGCFTGLTRYQKARKNLSNIESVFGGFSKESSHPLKRAIEQHTIDYPIRKEGMAIRQVELSRPLKPLEDISEYTTVRILVQDKSHLIGTIDLPTFGKPITKARLVEELINKFGVTLLLSHDNQSKAICQKLVWNGLKKRSTKPSKSLVLKGLPVDVLVSVIIATFDRPDDLRNCLRSLLVQETSRQVEIIVVDNNPASGLTPPVVAEFPSVTLINEARKGLSYARNTGFTASSGSICIATDDDVTMPAGWLEKLLAPFARADVMVVTGNVLPVELKNDAQVLFESYGGLGKGFINKEVNGAWFDSSRSAVATWHLGATANAAFRTSIFSHPQIGLLNEALGAGTPTGCSEDTYLFYKVLKAGYTLHYEADAFVWHRHRDTTAALRKQLYNYSKGHAAYNLMTWLTDGDWRGLRRVVFEVPLMFLRRTKARLRGRSNYPLALLWVEVKGHLSGPWSLWRANQRVRRLGRSTPYMQASTQTEVSVK